MSNTRVSSRPKTVETLEILTSRRKAQQRFRSLVVYAKMLGLRWNVRVVFDATTTTAKTNGEVIYLRPLSIGDESDAVLIEGLLDHEAGVHCRQTDFGLMQQRLQTASDLTRTLHNVFEDIWGERELKKVKPGCARSIARALDIMVDRGIFGPPKDDAHIASLLVGGLVNGLRSRKLGQSVLEPFFQERWARIEEHFGPELASRIWLEAETVDLCFDTGAAIDLAERITQMLREFLDEQPQQPDSEDEEPDEQGEGDGEGEPGTGSAAGDSEGQPPETPSPSSGPDDQDPNEDQAGDSGSGNGQESKSEGEGSSSSASSDGDETQPQDDPADAEAVRQGEQRRCETRDVDGTGSNKPSREGPKSVADSPAQEKGIPTGTAAPQPAPMTREELLRALNAVKSTVDASQDEAGTGELADALAEALGESNAEQEAQAMGVSAGNSWDLGSSDLSTNESIDALISEISRPVAVKLGSRLDSLLEAQVTANTYLKRQGRRIHPGKLVSVVTTGNQRIFKASDDVVETDTVLHVLTDVSGSMNAPFGASDGFGSSGSQTISRIGGAAAITRALGDVLNRFDVPFAVSYFGSCLTKVKGYDENWRTRKDLYWTRLESSTCTDQALIGIIPDLAVRIEARKLLVLVTDGVPSHAQATVLALSEARKLGIDVCVVMVTSSDHYSDQMLNAFTQELDQWEIPHSTARAVDELATTVFDAVKKAF